MFEFTCCTLLIHRILIESNFQVNGCEVLTGDVQELHDQCDIKIGSNGNDLPPLGMVQSVFRLISKSKLK